jgi:hypothetical protein
MRALFAALVFAAAPPDGICPNLSLDQATSAMTRQGVT